MSSADRDHLSAEELSAFSLGRLDEAELARLAAHVEACADCGTRLGALSIPDPLLAELQAAARPDGPVLEDVGLRRQAAQERHRELARPVASPDGAAQSPRGKPPGNPAVDSPSARPSPSSAPRAEVPRQIGDYAVREELGRGGMGMVYRAEDIHLRRAVALKVILPEQAADPVARERFLREARACASLRNDYVVTIYQVGQDGEVPYMAMEFLQGQTLDQRLRLDPPLTVAQSVRIGREVAEGLAAAHAQGLIHRDIKPANIWLESPSGRVKLLDFGLARPADHCSGLTESGNVVGTPEYMSPEQARGEDLDGRSDLFSLGTVLYVLCSGQRPFQGKTVMAVLMALAERIPRPLCQLNPDVPPELADLVDCLLQKAPEQRPVSARVVRQALAAIETGQPVPPGDTLRKPAKQTEIRRPGLPLDYPPQTAEQPPPRRSRRAILCAGGGALAAVALLTVWFGRQPQPGSQAQPAPSGPPIRVGVLHSRTGTMALSERPIIDALLLAIEEINEQGGLLGRPVEAVVADGQSDELVFAREAEKLIQDEKVCTIFGCWTSASRKAVVPVVERHDHVLFYPIGSEGAEQSAAIIYLGAVPNQRILPALRWLVGFENKRRWFLVGSDYVFPVVANAVVRDAAQALGCAVVGEEYLLLGSTDVAGVVAKIAEAKPDLIVNTINGDTNIAFFRALRRAGITSRSIPTLSISVAVDELNALGPRATAGDYVAAGYFQSLDNAQNREFLRRFGKRYGSERVVSSPMVTAYAGAHLWAKAVQSAGRDDARSIREAAKGQSYDGPQGPIRIDPATQHAVQTARVGRVDEAGHLVEVYLSPQPVMPEPFPPTRSRDEWLALLKSLHQRWGGRWSNTGP